MEDYRENFKPGTQVAVCLPKGRAWLLKTVKSTDDRSLGFAVNFADGTADEWPGRSMRVLEKTAAPDENFSEGRFVGFNDGRMNAMRIVGHFKVAAGKGKNEERWIHLEDNSVDRLIPGHNYYRPIDQEEAIEAVERWGADRFIPGYMARLKEVALKEANVSPEFNKYFSPRLTRAQAMVICNGAPVIGPR